MTVSQPRDEKEEEKRHEKEEKGRGDPLSGAIWGAIVIWAGLVLLADNLRLLAPFQGPGGRVFGPLAFHLETWGIIFFGAGVIVLFEVAVRLLVPTYRRPVLGTAILALVLMGIGLGSTFGWGVIWPLILIVIGVAILLRGVWRG